MPCHHHTGTGLQCHTYKIFHFKVGKRIINVTGGTGAVADGT